jgi:UrcA family protein
MIKKLPCLCAMLLVLGTFGAGTALAATDATEEVTVDSPYTIRQQVLPRTSQREMAARQTSISREISFADLDFSKQADVDIMRQRIRQAARETCDELDRRFPPTVYVPVQEARPCIATTTLHAFGRLDEARAVVRRPAFAGR